MPNDCFAILVDEYVSNISIIPKIKLIQLMVALYGISHDDITHLKQLDQTFFFLKIFIFDFIINI